MKKKIIQSIVRLAKTVLFYEAFFRARGRRAQAQIPALKEQYPEQLKVSILIPVYNVAEFLPQCLDSVLAQTYQNLEIICVNDAATDQSLTILQDYAQKDSRIKVIDKAQNEGLPQARKTALAAACGAYVLNIDSDDWLEADMVENLYYFAQSGFDVVVCDYFKEYPKRSEAVFQRKILEQGDKLERISQRSFGSANTIWNRFIKREIAEKIEFPTENAGEDIVINAQLYFYAERIGYFAKPLYHWRTNPDSMTNQLTQATFDGLRINYDLVYGFCQEKFGSEALKVKALYEERIAHITREP